MLYQWSQTVNWSIFHKHTIIVSRNFHHWNWIKRLSQADINFYEIFCFPSQTKNIFSKLQKVWCNKVLNWFEKCKFLFYLCRSEWKLFLSNSFSVIVEKHVLLKKKTLRENHLYSKEINRYFSNIISKGTITKTFGKLYNLFWQKRLFWK